MPADVLPSSGTRGAASGDAAVGSAFELLRALVVALGAGWSLVFVVVGLRYRLQMYGDGSIFSYAVAVQDFWAMHWHNLSGRLFVHLYSHVPAELYVGLTRDPSGGIVVYGLLFFIAPLLGLIATFAADRSRGRIIFGYACASTACACPMVFGFATEMWIAHAVFWPALAICHYARGGAVSIVLVFTLLLALAFTHEAGLVLAAAVVATLALRGLREPTFLRAAGAVLAVAAIWIVVKVVLPPDDYYLDIFDQAALHFFDVVRLAEGTFLRLLVGALAAYGIVFWLLRRSMLARAHLWAVVIVAAALTVYWVWFDRSLHTYHRYFLRTVLFAATLAFGGLAALYALRADDRLNPPVALPFLPRLMAALGGDMTARAAAGAVLLATAVHAVETVKFVTAWTTYEAAVRTLAMGGASDPALGDPSFVSDARIDPRVNRLAWNSTTPYLSAVVAPGLAPARLVVDPRANYFWLSCATATASEKADSAVPAATRRLVRVYACLHRK